MTKLTSAQLDEVVEQYAEIVLDRMDYKDLEQYVYDSLTDYYGKMSEVELKDHIIEIENSGCSEDNLFDELVDNLTPVTPAIDPKTYTYGLEPGESISFPVHDPTK